MSNNIDQELLPLVNASSGNLTPTVDNIQIKRNGFNSSVETVVQEYFNLLLPEGNISICTCIFQLGGEQDTCPDRNDFDGTIHTTKQSGFKSSEAEGGDDDLALVGETVGDVVDGGEEGEEPGFRVGQCLDTPVRGHQLVEVR